MNGPAGDKFIGGIVLCGGKSVRMGTDKAWLAIGDRKLLQRTVEVVAEVAYPVVVVKAAGQELPELPEYVELAADRMPERGPLEGFIVGLRRMVGRREAVLAVGCDYPFLRGECLSMLAGCLDESEVVVARVGGRLHPLRPAPALLSP